MGAIEAERARRFISGFGAQFPIHRMLRGSYVERHELAFDELKSVRVYAVLAQDGGGSRRVLLDDVEPFYMDDQRDLRDSVERIFGLPRDAATHKLRGLALWED